MTISILNFLAATIEIIKITKEEEDDISTVDLYLESLGFDLNQISYMVSNDVIVKSKDRIFKIE